MQGHTNTVFTALVRAIGPAVLLSAALAMSASAQDGWVERELYVTVERDNKLIGGLGEGNFVVREDGVERPFRIEEPGGRASIALLVEHSERTRLYRDDIDQSIRGFLDSAPDGNWYALATFNHSMEIVVDFTRQKGEVSSAYQQLGSPLWDEVDTHDAIHNIVDRMSRLPGRRILIVIGSGLDDNSARGIEDIEEQLEAANIVVYALGAASEFRTRYEPYLGSTDRLELLKAEAFFRMLADTTGGQAWFPQFSQGFGGVLEGIFQMEAYRYRIVYKSPRATGGEFREVEVEAFRDTREGREEFDVRVREGWRLSRERPATSASGGRLR